MDKGERRHLIELECGELEENMATSWIKERWRWRGSRRQGLGLGLWIFAFLFLPSLLIYSQMIPPGTEFIPRLILIFALPPLFLRRVSFRLGMLVVLLSAILSLFSPVGLRKVIDGLNDRFQDAFFVLRGPRTPTGEVVIVDIDQKALEEVGQWPWPRSQMAKAVEVLKEDGARVIGFDIVFPEPDSLSLQNWLERIEEVAGTAPQGELSQGIPSVTLKKLVLGEWEERLQATDPTFTVDPSLSELEREELVVKEYLKEQRGAWEEEQKNLEERFERVGLTHVAQPFLNPPHPILDMARHTRELFFLQGSLEKSLLESKPIGVILDNDQALGDAFHDPRVVAGGLFVTEVSAGTRMGSYQKKEARRETRGMVVASGIIGAEMVFPGIREGLEQVLNVPTIQASAYHQGSFNIVPDGSGAARSYTFLMRAPTFQESLVLKPGLEDLHGMALLDPDNYETKIVSQQFTYPSLVLEMFRAANGYEQVLPGYKEEQRGVTLRRGEGFEYDELYTDLQRSTLPKERFIPLDYKADLLIDHVGYGGPWKPESRYSPEYFFQYVSLADVAQKTFPQGTFQGKYVLIGSSDPTLSDLVGSPFRPAFPGLEVHAVMLDNLLQERYLVHHGKWATLYQFLGILVMGTLIAAAVAYLDSFLAGTVSVLVLGGLPALSYWGLVHGGVALNFVYPWFACALMTAVIILTNFFVEGKERRFVVNQFSKMVSPEILSKLREDPRGASLNGKKAEISVMFSDVAGFTSISEGMSPQKLILMLNDYFDKMTQVIMSHDGFIDKFIGDAIMGVWGVPVADKNHGVKACRATLEQQRVLKGLAQQMKKEHGVDLVVRMGVATGVASAAFMGSESRKSFTVMGDVINLGARLEPACKQYESSILICEKTFDQAKEQIEARCVDRLVVKGKTLPVAIYELLGMKGEISQNKLERAQKFERALELHWERKWEEALSLLDGILKGGSDGAALQLKERILHYQQHPPPHDWSGEYVRQGK